MKQLLFKLFFVPFIAFFAMMITVAMLGSIYDTNWLKEHLDGSGLVIWQAWIGIISIIITVHHFLKKKVEE